MILSAASSIPSILTSLYSVFMSLLGITSIIVFHEFGHFIFCKLFNVYTPTFSIGMGQILLSKKIGQTNFCLSLLPIGGYVEIASEKGISGTKGFEQIPYYQKFLIMLGGIFCNFLLTYLIFAGLFFTGIPESGLPYETNKPTVSTISQESINFHNLKPTDRIVSINNINVENNASIIKQEALKQLKINRKDIPAAVIRNNKEVKTLLNLQEKQSSLTKMLEVSFDKKPPLSLQSSLTEAYFMTKACSQAIISGLKQLVSSNAGKSFVGPILAVAESSKSAKQGISHLLLLLAIISINLGIINLLPLPIFDGGQFLIFTIEAVTRRKLSEKVQNNIAISSWVLAIGLMIIFSLKDIHTLIFS